MSFRAVDPCGHEVGYQESLTVRDSEPPALALPPRLEIECDGTGFLGRSAVCELLNLSDTIRELILERRPASEIKRVVLWDG